MKAQLAIHNVGVVAPIGTGFPAFANALRAAAAPAPRPPSAALCGNTPWPAAPAHWLADFDARVHLGDKGLSALDRTTQISIVACKEALQGAALGGSDAKAVPSDIGVVLGSMAGGMRSIADFVRSTYTPTPHMVSPLQFPNTVMNCAAGQCAIWHGLRGVNSTVCAGELSGLAALQYASRMLRLGHARSLLAGSVEEYCDFTAWAHAASPDAATRPLGEGAAVFRLSAAGGSTEHRGEPGPALAELLAIRVRAVPAVSAAHAAGRMQAETRGAAAVRAAALAQALSREVAALLAEAEVDAGALRWWSGHAAEGERCAGVERTALYDLGALNAAAIRRWTVVPPRVAERCGRSYAASVSLQLAGALALAPAGLGLLTAVSEQGQAGCAMIRISDPAASHQAH